MIETGSLIHPECFAAGAIVVGCLPDPKRVSDKVACHPEISRDELVSLLTTLGVTTHARMWMRLQRIAPSSFVGAGKLAEISEAVACHQAKLVVVDAILTGAQLKNLEKELGLTVLDRPAIILEIFARHARTRQAKTQVEIAQLEYLLPKLTGAWTHFTRQRGGSHLSKGMGETQIEIDRRRARQRIARRKRELAEIETGSNLQRKQRQDCLKLAIVGYTNSGKTTLMHRLTQSEVDGEDALFATLDSRTRQLDPNARPRVLVSDTVGFIHNLPTSLIESFKSTLAEVREADLILHVVDLASSSYQLQFDTTVRILEELGASELPQFVFLNKTDLLPDSLLPRLVAKRFAHVAHGSALDREAVRHLRQAIIDFFAAHFEPARIVLQVEDQVGQALIFRECLIDQCTTSDDGQLLIYDIRAQPEVVQRLREHHHVNM